MYKKFILAMIENSLCRYFGAIYVIVKARYNSDTGMVNFEARGMLKDSHKPGQWEGYVGTLGQIVITTIDCKELEEYITIN